MYDCGIFKQILFDLASYDDIPYRYIYLVLCFGKTFQIKDDFSNKFIE